MIIILSLTSYLDFKNSVWPGKENKSDCEFILLIGRVTNPSIFFLSKEFTDFFRDFIE